MVVILNKLPFRSEEPVILVRLPVGLHRLSRDQSHLMALLPQRCTHLDPSMSPRTSAFALRPCGFHSASATGFASFAEQESHLWFAASCQRRNSTRSGSKPQASRCRDRLLQCVTHLEPETQTSSPCLLRHPGGWALDHRKRGDIYFRKANGDGWPWSTGDRRVLVAQ